MVCTYLIPFRSWIFQKKKSHLGIHSTSWRWIRAQHQFGISGFHEEEKNMKQTREDIRRIREKLGNRRCCRNSELCWKQTSDSVRKSVIYTHTTYRDLKGRLAPNRVKKLLFWHHNAQHVKSVTDLSNNFNKFLHFSFTRMKPKYLRTKYPRTSFYDHDIQPHTSIKIHPSVTQPNVCLVYLWSNILAE